MQAAVRDRVDFYGNGPNLATKSINKIPDEKKSHWMKSLAWMEQGCRDEAFES
jgi:hypothetical protein